MAETNQADAGNGGGGASGPKDEAGPKLVGAVLDAAKIATESSLARSPRPLAAVRREVSPTGSAPPLAAVSGGASEFDSVVGAEVRSATKAIETAAAAAVAAPMKSGEMTTPATTLRSIEDKAIQERMMTTAEELMSFQQGNVEAMMKSGQIWAAGLQDLGRRWAATAHAQMDETMGTVKALAAAKSLREAVELQSTLARASVEKVVSEGGKLTDASLKLAEQTMAPITARLTLAAERFGRPVA